MKIKELETEYRPREKAQLYGLESLSDTELLCLLIGSGTSSASVEKIAEKFLEKSKDLRSYMEMDFRQFMEVEGIGLAKAMQLSAGKELVIRSLKRQTYSKTIRSPVDVVQWMQLEYGTKSQEHFAAIYLNAKQKIIKHKTLFIGTLNHSLIHPRDVFKEAICVNAAGILFVHNHPSNDPAPSRADLDTTRVLVEVGKMTDINVLDHIIVGKDTYFSMKEHNMLD